LRQAGVIETELARFKARNPHWPHPAPSRCWHASVVPVLISRLTQPLPAAPSLSQSAAPFVIRRYLRATDLVPGAAKDACGQVPLICLADFDMNATQKINDDLMQAVLALAHDSPGGIRITPAMNLLDARFGYFIETMPAMDVLPAGQSNRCAALIETRNCACTRSRSWGQAASVSCSARQTAL
jgi:hypothetical protein